MAPREYLPNITGCFEFLEGCRVHAVKKALLASSGTVYGVDGKIVNMYAASKRACEDMGRAYSACYGLSVTAARFFSVYGPFGRPDMAPFIFASAIAKGEPVYINGGDTRRDFTYVKDAALCAAALLEREHSGFEAYDIGACAPVTLDALVTQLELALGKKAERVYLPGAANEARSTRASCSSLRAAIGFSPGTSIEEGAALFIDWFMARQAV